MTLRIGELFAGMGGLGMGVQATIGGDVAWYSDIDKGALKILRHRFPDVPNIGDITAVDWSQVEPVDVLTGGFPCQDVSPAGKRAGLRPGTRSGLWSQFAYAIDQLRPPLVVIENVRGLLSAEAHSDVEPCPWCVGDDTDGALRALGAVLGDLADRGYDAVWYGLRAADVGAPHGRFRVFVVAWPADSTGYAGRGVHGDRGPAADAGCLRGDAWRGAGPREATGGRTFGEPPGRGLLPAPLVSDSGQSITADVTTRHSSQLRSIDRMLLPTPRATDGTKGGPNQRGSSGDLMLPSAVALLPTPAVNDNQRRIVARSEVDPETGCWVWTGWTNEAATPYGRLSIDNRKVYAHRAAYEAFVGPIPEGHEVDHLCQASLCVNPEHLETVTPEENRARVAQRRTYCKRGHEFTEYADAIARWETHTRPAPAPTETGPKGSPRLSPRFTEWMMGLPEGWITDVPGITRNEALRACGNGVVPQQASEALRVLLPYVGAVAA